MADIDIQWFLGIAKKAGRLALSHFGNTEGTLKPDESWVTQADLEVEEYLRSEIQDYRPEDDILGEEGDNPTPQSPYVWAIDPIDGTRVFNHGLPVWGVSIGLLIDGVPTLGAFVLPVLGDVYYTDGKEAYCNDIVLTSPNPSIDANAVFLISESAFGNVHVDYPGKVLQLGSAAANLCYVARGSAVAALDKAGIWDYAACAAILRVLDVPFRYLSGPEVDFTALYENYAVPEPTLICSREHFDSLQSAVRNIE